MRTTTFDMVGMALMAIVTIVTSGGVLTWNYFRQLGRSNGESAAADDLGSLQVVEADEARAYAGHR